MGLRGERAGKRRPGGPVDTVNWTGLRQLFNEINDLAALQTIIYKVFALVNTPNQGLWALRAARPADLVRERRVDNIRDRGPGEPPNNFDIAARVQFRNFRVHMNL